MTHPPTVPMPEPSGPAALTARLARWWSGRTVGYWLRLAALVVAAVLVSVVYGVATARTTAGLGPHIATYAVTTDSTITIDVGPLGTLQLDSPLPATLGVRAVVQEIPASVTTVDASTTLQALGGDLQTYVQFFSAPQATIHDITQALINDAVQRAAGAFVLLVGIWVVGRLLLGPARRRELTLRAAQHSRVIAGVVVAVVVGGTVLTASDPLGSDDAAGSRRSTVFDGTALEGARVTGRLGGVLDTYGAQVLAAYRANNAFYAAADDAMVAAWDTRQAQIDAEAAAQALRDEDEPSVAGTAAPTDAPTDAPSGEPADEAADEPADEPSATEEAVEPVVLLLVSDLHCNVGMAPLITSLAERSGADVILDAGDTTMNGTTVEQYCVTTFAQAAPDGVPLVTSPGNHDSKDTTALYAHAGATVLSGEVIEVAGMRILGDSDPNETRLGAGTSAAGRETPDEESQRLADVACDDDGVDLLLVHTPRVGKFPLEDGCVPAQLSGHLHRRVDPVRIGDGVRYVNSSTAGATSGQPTVGPLHGTAELTVLHFDPQERRFLDYQLVQVHKDGSVEVGDRVPWPRLFRTEPPDDDS
ncbi:metallophosphoesterase [Cellulomonas hominis]